MLLLATLIAVLLVVSDVAFHVRARTTSKTQSPNDPALYTGLQSGTDTASSYAGGMVYHQGILYVTGATYGTNFFHNVSVDTITASQGRVALPATAFPYVCFVASIEASAATALAWGVRQRFVVVNTQHHQQQPSQACTTLATSASSNNNNNNTAAAPPELFVIGYQQAEWNGSSYCGLSTGIRYDTTLSTSAASTQSKAYAVNAGQEPVVYPKSITSVVNASHTFLFLAGMIVASDITWNGTATPHDDSVDPTIHFDGALGSVLNVQKLVRKSAAAAAGQPNIETWETVWDQSYSTYDNSSVHVTSTMLYVPQTRSHAKNSELIVMAGSTTGFGLAFGANVPSSGPPHDMDGFVTKLNAETGILYGVQITNTNTSTTTATTTTVLNGSTYSTRIHSQPGFHDYVMGLCQSPPSGTASNKVFYAVGTTQGIMAGSEPGGAFLMQMDVDTLQPLWTRQISGVDVDGMACAVTPDGQYVYLGGNHAYNTPFYDDNTNVASRRSRLEETGPSTASTSEIFVAQLNTFSGTLIWIQTIGTEGGNESIAQGNGLVVDDEGNVFVYGNTRGSLFRNNNPQQNSYNNNDVFVSFLSRDIVGTPFTYKTDHRPKRMVIVIVVFLMVVLVTIVVMGFLLAFRKSSAKAKPAPAAMVDTAPTEKEYSITTDTPVDVNKPSTEKEHNGNDLIPIVMATPLHSDHSSLV